MSTLVRPAVHGVRQKAVVHHLPARLDADGPAPVSAYFVVEPASPAKPTDAESAGAGAPAGKPTAPEPSKDLRTAAAHHTAMLRGRAVDGVVATLPSGFEGLVVSEAHFEDLSTSRASSPSADGAPLARAVSGAAVCRGAGGVQRW